jgi:concentrative nucleoside transporter, CNT family
MINILWGLGGIAALVVIAYLLSSDRKAINWRTVGVGIVIQILFAFLVLKSELGRKIVQAAGGAFDKMLAYTQDGVTFLFGNLTQSNEIGYMWAFGVLPTVIFFSALISVLYYFGIMQFIVKTIGYALAKLLGVSKVEALGVTADIFVGPTEAPLVIKPYIDKLTRSELFAVMVGGLASVAGSILAGYAMLGIPFNYLLAASFMAAPAGLIMAKLFVPEKEEKAKEEDIEIPKSDAVNVVDAAAKGASEGVQLVLNIAGMILAFVALMALVNGVIGGVGNLFGLHLTLEGILGYLFAPIAFLIGVPLDEAVQAGSFIGQKMALNEFVAFTNLGPVIESMSPKTAMVTTFALCGFANFSVIAILLGGLGVMAPKRRSEIASLGIKALIAATLANLLSAAIAGMMM